MLYIGIDFSLNNTAVTIFDTAFSFYVFPNINNMFTKKELPTTKYETYDKLKSIINVIEYKKENLELDYSEEQRYKLVKANELTDNIIAIIPKDKQCKIGLEGFSYNSYGASEIDLIMFNTLLRYKLTIMPNITLDIFSPKTIKKFAGNGNADKTMMLNFFKNEDGLIRNTEYFKYVISTDEYIKGKNKEINSPITDINDAYFITKYLINGQSKI